MYLGAEASDGSFFGTAAYSSVWYTPNHSAYIIGPSSNKLVISSTGIAVTGAATFSSTATATDFILSSDSRKKTNIVPIESALEKLDRIYGYTFEFKKALGISRAGVIAQEIEKVLPEAVYTDSEGYMSVSYDAIIPLLIQAIRELRKEVKK
jgi:hypothetical protein